MTGAGCGLWAVGSRSEGRPPRLHEHRIVPVGERREAPLATAYSPQPAAFIAAFPPQ